MNPFSIQLSTQGWICSSEWTEVFLNENMRSKYLHSLCLYRRNISKRLPCNWPRRNGAEHNWKLPTFTAERRWLMCFNRFGKTLALNEIHLIFSSGYLMEIYLWIVISWQVLPRLSLMPAYWNNEVFILIRKGKICCQIRAKMSSLLETCGDRLDCIHCISIFFVENEF